MYGSICSLIATGQDGWPWCARLIGFDKKYGYQREFVKGVIDYSHVFDGNRGKVLYWSLQPGVYQVLEQINQSRARKYFARVNEDGTVIEVDREEVDKCLKNGC